MKKVLIICLTLFTIKNSYSQTEYVEQSGIDFSENNRWTIEASAGYAKGVKPFSPGYFSNKPNGVLGGVLLNSFGLGARYMISPSFGLKGNFTYDLIKNHNNSGSLPFEMEQIGFSAQGVVNLGRVWKIDQTLKRLGFLAHAGVKVDRMKSNTENIIENDHNFGVDEYNVGMIFGLTPQFRITKRMTMFVDFSFQTSFRQHFNWDGAYSDAKENLNGQVNYTSFGLTYSLGKNDMHGDFTMMQTKNTSEFDALNKRVGDIETLMNDTDKDGVPDSLDQENNSVAGVAVDSRGKMVDFNRDGVPDELEKKLNEKYSTKEESNELVENFVNDGYVAAYFDFNKSQPTNESTEGIDFILTYMRKNPTAKLDILGHADAIGNTPANIALADKRANAVKDILVKAGISADRIDVVSKGEDNSVDEKSEGARSLVRRVTFKIK